MDKYTLEINVNIKRNGEDYYKEGQASFQLSKEQLIEMEKDLIDLKLDWAEVSGIK